MVPSFPPAIGQAPGKARASPRLHSLGLKAEAALSDPPATSAEPSQTEETVHNVPRLSPPRTFRVLVTTSWIPGGVTTWTHEFANHMAARGHEVTCVFLKPKWPLLRTPPLFRDIKYHPVWLEASPLSFVSAIPRFLATYLRAHPAEFIVSTEAEGTGIFSSQTDSSRPCHVAVVHVAEPVYVDRKRLLLATLAMGRTVVLAPLSLLKGRADLTEQLMPLYWQWVQYLGRKRLEQTRVAVCVSRSQGQAIQSAWGIPPAKIHVIYNGIDVGKFRPPDQLVGNERRLLYVGGSNPRKGVDVLLEAFALVSRRCPQVLLELVGGWNWSIQIEKARSLGILSQVRFHSYLVHDELPAYYARAYAFIAPSRVESFGRTIAEAMACGVPVISTQAGGIAEVVDHGISGILVPWRNVKALAEAMVELLNDPSRARALGREGRKRVEEHFAWDVIAPQWEDLFVQLGGQSHGSTNCE